MKKKVITGIELTLLILSMLTFPFGVHRVKASGTIYIRADGSVDPPSAPIVRHGDLYILTDNIASDTNGILIERNDMTLDGAGYTLQGTSVDYGIYVEGRNNVTIKNLKVEAFYYGVGFLWTINSRISGDTITANTIFGIFLWSSSGNIIYGNYIVANTIEGIRLDSSSNGNIVSGNLVAASDEDGVQIESSSGNRVYGNNVTNNFQGINLCYASNNVVAENSVARNRCGIYLDVSSGNLIYHNNFINNFLEQVHIYDSTNDWDHGYPAGGNYWSDYTGVDTHKGPYQNVTGGDGIGDTSYVIDGSNRDNYPLMEPWHAYTTTGYPWSMFRHDLRHTGYSESPAPNTNNILWTYLTADGVWSSPAVADGMVFVGSNDNNVYALDQYTGGYLWSYTTGDDVFSSPAVADGKVYVGSYDRKVYCLDAATGAHIWSYTTGVSVDSSPAVADGKVYIGSNDGKVYCLNASTGAKIWSYTTASFSRSSPVVVDGKVYVGSSNNKVYCLNALTGAHIWNYTTGGSVYSSPVVVDGKVYVGSLDFKVYCLNASTGALIWSYTTGNYVYSSPAVAYGKVYVGSTDFKVYCLNASTGALIWSYTTGGSVYYSSPAVADGKVYVGGASNKKVYCLDAATGALIWSYTTGNYVYSSPAVADGVVYIGSYDNKVYAFGNVIRVPEDYPTVTEAIKIAPQGATISIAPGIYYESVVINKPLTILGRKGSAPTFVGGGSGIAFTLQAGASGSIIAGIVVTNYAQAIFIDGASNCKIYDNIMTRNVNSGIAEGNSAANNLIYNNIFQENCEYTDTCAISLTQYSTSTVYNNTIILNSIGLNIASSGNTIYWNIFIDNTRQVQVAASLSNNWDNGYPDGGNYWSGYTGVDEKSGPGQNLAGSDGIGDTPYTIDVPNNIIDGYPLMRPFSPHDIGVMNVIPSKIVVEPGSTLQIDSKIINYGIHNEAFTVTLYADANIIATQAITLAKRSSTIITFTWNTFGFAKGSYSVSVTAWPVQDETYTADNRLIDGWVILTIPGDCAGADPMAPPWCDGQVFWQDLLVVLVGYGATPSDPRWTNYYLPRADFNSDNQIFWQDLLAVLINYGTSDP